MTQEQYRDKWNERHFQLILALVNRPSYDAYGGTKPVKISDIVRKADALIEYLQDREARFIRNEDE